MINGNSSFDGAGYIEKISTAQGDGNVVQPYETDNIYGPELPPDYHKNRRQSHNSAFQYLANNVGKGDLSDKMMARSVIYYYTPRIKFTGEPWTESELEKIYDAMDIVRDGTERLLEDVDYVIETLPKSHYNLINDELNDYRNVLLGVKATTLGFHGIELKQKNFGRFSDAAARNYNNSQLIELNTRDKGWMALGLEELAGLLFHEITHDFGTIDDDSKGYLMNAHNIDDRIMNPQPNLYKSVVFFLIFKDLGINPPIDPRDQNDVN